MFNLYNLFRESYIFDQKDLYIYKLRVDSHETRLM